VPRKKSSSSKTLVWPDNHQRDFYHVVVAFVDSCVRELKSSSLSGGSGSRAGARLGARLNDLCKKMGRVIAASFRGTDIDVDQSTSWELLSRPPTLLGQLTQSASMSLTGSATTIGAPPSASAAARLFLWQVFIEHLAAQVFEAFCFAVARDYTSQPLATILEGEEGESDDEPWEDVKLCFPFYLRLAGIDGVDGGRMSGCETGMQKTKVGNRGLIKKLLDKIVREKGAGGGVEK